MRDELAVSAASQTKKMCKVDTSSPINPMGGSTEHYCSNSNSSVITTKPAHFSPKGTFLFIYITLGISSLAFIQETFAFQLSPNDQALKNRKISSLNPTLSFYKKSFSTSTWLSLSAINPEEETNVDNDNEEEENLEKQSIMKNRAIAALGGGQDNSNILKENEKENDENQQKKTQDDDNKKESTTSTFTSLLPPRIPTSKGALGSSRAKNDRRQGGKSLQKSLTMKKENGKGEKDDSSLLLPPLPPLPPLFSTDDDNGTSSSILDFKGAKASSNSNSGLGPLPDFPVVKEQNGAASKLEKKSKSTASTSLPPPPFAVTQQEIKNKNVDSSPNSFSNRGENAKTKLLSSLSSKENDSKNPLALPTEFDDTQSPAPSSSSSLLSSLDGVLPVSELFYKSTPQPIPSLSSSIDAPDTNIVEGQDDDIDDDEDDDMDTDDEELPFSAEQTNRVYSNGNKIHIRRNVQQSSSGESQGKSGRRRSSISSSSGDDTNDLEDSSSSNRAYNRYEPNKRRGTKNYNSPKNKLRTNLSTPKRKDRKMVRRGMEMLVGGDPINADPPLRFVELTFDEDTDDWVQKITLNSRDFGPLLHQPSATKVSEISRGLYCENFVSSALKWKVCPEELRVLVQDNESLFKKENIEQKNNGDLLLSYNDLMQQMIMLNEDSETAASEDLKTANNNDPDLATTTTSSSKRENAEKSISSKKKAKETADDKQMSSSSFFGRHVQNKQEEDGQNTAVLEGGELKFTIGVNRTDIEDESENGTCSSKVLSRILARGITRAIRSSDLGYTVIIDRLVLSEVEPEVTEISVLFKLIFLGKKLPKTLKSETKQINQALSDAVNGADMALALAASVKEDDGWPDSVKNQVIEELLFEVDDVEEPILEVESDDDEDEREDDEEEEDDDRETKGNLEGPNPSNIDDEEDVPFGLPGSCDFSPDDIYLSGGNGGVFFDYSEENMKASPYSGYLGPLLVDAVVERAKQRQPRVIAIGDVHGCLDELQALLRRCDYRPGDLVVFLGDLVSKGPDSLSVVQMAREIGAIGVRGNHDFEVIRWHQAIMSGKETILPFK